MQPLGRKEESAAAAVAYIYARGEEGVVTAVSFLLYACPSVADSNPDSDSELRTTTKESRRPMQGTGEKNISIKYLQVVVVV